MVLKVDDAANFVFVQLNEQEPGIYDKCNADCARRGKIDLVAWGRIFRETKESGSWFFRNNISTRVCHGMFSFPNIVFKHPVALIYHLFHIYFRLKCNLLSSVDLAWEEISHRMEESAMCVYVYMHYNQNL
jgi:hypothetical protein